MLVHIATNGASSALNQFTEDQIQPNAIDLRLDRVWSMTGDFMITNEDKKTHRSKIEILPTYDSKHDLTFFHLNPGTYEISFRGLVNMGPDEAGYVITRSTLNRNGLFITSGLYDSGYNGNMAACLHVEGGPAFISPGARIGQFILWKSQAVSSYDGDYGINKQMDSHLRS